MKPPKCVKDIQKLTGCMTALSHFISWLRGKGLPFFKLLKAKEKFEWLEEVDAAFAKLMQFLTSPSSGPDGAQGRRNFASLHRDN
jgi:hypothetical protein